MKRSQSASLCALVILLSLFLLLVSCGPASGKADGHETDPAAPDSSGSDRNDTEAPDTAPTTSAPAETTHSEPIEYDASVVSCASTDAYPVLDAATGQPVVLENGEARMHTFSYPCLTGTFQNAESFNQKLASFCETEHEKAQNGSAGDEIYRVTYLVSVKDNIAAVYQKNEIETQSGDRYMRSASYYYDLEKDAELSRTGYLKSYGLNEDRLTEALLADDTFFDACVENDWYPTYDQFINPNYHAARYLAVWISETGDAVVSLYLEGFAFPYQEFTLPGIANGSV